MRCQFRLQKTQVRGMNKIVKRRGRPTGNENMERTIAFRVSAEIAARIDAYRERLQRDTGVEINASNIARSLLLRGLEAVESEPKRKK
jgi:hypothetical protein